MTESATETLNTAQAHLRAFDALRSGLPGAGLDWLERLRADALGRFKDAGLPSRRLEAWKFTTLAALERAPFAPGPQAGGAPDALPELTETAARITFVDGRFDEGLSEISRPAEGVSVTTMATALANDPGALQGRLSQASDPAGSLWDLNAAFMADGAVIRLADGAALDQPIHLVFLASGTANRACHIRNLILLGTGARAQVVETYGNAADAAGAGFTSAVTDISLAEGAALTHARVQDESLKTVHAARAVVSVAGEAVYAGFALAMGAEVSRQETDLSFAAPDGHARLMGAYLGRGRQLLDHTTRVDHAVPGCTTEELFKGVLDDHAHGVFQGLIRVAPHALHTDARQKSQALLLSDRAAADTKPELEILADDVKCAHGATVGDLDDDALFYLMARGVPEAEARRLLIAGFAGDVIDSFDRGIVGAYLSACVANWQDRGTGDGHA
ncbi:MAG: Fe-S cluster assembly protein SufD [Alphaproteobacteria bacterium]|nr:Fe-S cluster assembly protein SufD [Alphaproteobacteria bacterium]